jgi:hypothetical protein
MKPVLITIIIIIIIAVVLCAGCTTPVEEPSYSVYTPAVPGTVSPATLVPTQVNYGSLSYSSNRPPGISVSISKIDTQIMLYYFGGPDAAGLAGIETIVRNSESEEFFTNAKRPVPGDEIAILGGTNGLDYVTVIAAFSDGSNSLILDTYV